MEWVPLLTYLIALAALTAVGAPIAALFFRALPRNGAAFALPAALAPFTITIFWLGQLTFGLHTLVVGVAVLLAGSAAAYRAGARPEWQTVATTYAVFAIGFLLMVAFRVADPGVTPQGGEQFLHFGLVNALERANTLPPEDMWFAGRPLRYYYGTQLQVASLSMLTGTAMRYGFNLGIATFYGMLFVVAYGVGGAIVHRQGHSYRLGGIFGTFFVALAGPTTTAVRLATPHLPEPMAEAVKPAAFGFVADRFKGGDLAIAVAELSKPLDWGWWYTRYVVPGTIQEVPLYSFVKADLHGHTFANGYVLFAGALALAYYATPAEERARRAAIVFGGLGALAGLFGFMNTWSLPTAAGLAILAVAVADPHPATLLPESWSRRLQPSTSASTGDWSTQLVREIWRLVLASVVGVVVLLIGVVIASPFLVFGHVPMNEGIGFFPPRSPLGPFLVIYAGLLTIFTLAVAARSWPAILDISIRGVATGCLLLVGALATLALVDNVTVLLVLGTLVVAGWLLVRTDNGGFELVLLVAGAGLLIALELVHARLPLVNNPRWNTALKVAVQAWTLGAAGAGAATAILIVRNADRLAHRVGLSGATDGRDGRPVTEPSTGATLFSVATVVLIGVVLLASAVFPVMMVGAEIGTELDHGNYDPSLDALEAAERFHANEYDALRWLKNRPGHPTLVEAPGDSYSWTSPASTFSGLPGVIGWDHEAEYRGPEAYQRRVDRVDAIYTGNWSAAARNLKRYDVTYIYVGPNERERYGEDLRSFDREAFSVAFEGGAVTIYEVDHSTLSTQAE